MQIERYEFVQSVVFYRVRGVGIRGGRRVESVTSTYIHKHKRNGSFALGFQKSTKMVVYFPSIEESAPLWSNWDNLVKHQRRKLAMDAQNIHSFILLRLLSDQRYLRPRNCWCLSLLLRCCCAHLLS